MKILIVTIGNIYRLPYIDRYLNHVPRNSEVDLVSWNREGLEETKPGTNLLSFNYEIGESAFQKALGYLKYRRFVKKVLVSGEYDLVVVTPTQTALLLSNILIKYYSHRYIVDIRDYCHENLWLVRKLEKRVIGNAAATVVSSSGYKEFLPDSESYCLVHNNRELPQSEVETIVHREKKRQPLTIGFVGFVAYHEQHKRLLRLFANDSRFTLAFIGAGSEALADFCEQEKILNTDIRGSFAPNEIMNIYSGIDIINGIYGENCPELDYALSNKLYFAGDLAMPIIVNSGTIMQKVSEQYGIGFAVDMSDPETPDKLYCYYNNINWDELSSGAQEFMHKVHEDNEEFEVKLDIFFNDKD